MLISSLILLRYTAISVVPAAIGKKVRDIASKVHIFMVILHNNFMVCLCHGHRTGVEVAETQTDTMTSDCLFSLLFIGQS